VLGCEICKCKTEFAVGQGCDQETGQCKCLDGVVGINCDGCPNDWVLVMNETRKGVDVCKKNTDVGPNNTFYLSK
jgi:laminin alpha 3/5